MKPPMRLMHRSALAPVLFLASCSTMVKPAAVSAPVGTATLDAPSSEVAAALPEPSLGSEFTLPLEAGDFRAIPKAPQGARSGPRWGPGQPLLQGFFGATIYEEIERSGGGRPTVDGSDDDLAQMPSIGGGGQFKFGGDAIDMGLEAMIGFNWRSNATAIAIGGGGAAVAVDVDLFLFDLYGGPFASVFLGDHVRAYVAAGPLMQWAQYEQTAVSLDGNGSGFGLGYYARTGFEFVVGMGTMLGLGVRWSDSRVDLDDNQGELDLAGFQVVFTVSRFN